MKQSSKRIIAIVLGFVVFFHFLLIGIYCLPFNYFSSKIRAVSNLYVYPVFNQNWCLFVPPPTAQNRIFIRYQTANGYSNWIDVLEQEIMTHKSSPLSGHEAVYLLLSNSLIYEFAPLMEKTKLVYDDKPNHIQFDVLNFEVQRYLKLNYKLNINTKYEMLLVSTDKTSGNAYYIKSLQIN